MANLHTINPNCAGIDIGSETIFISVENQVVRSFGTFTDEFLKAIAYLKEHEITSVAMKTTARKIAELYYNLMTKGIDYVEHGVELYQQRLKEQQLKRLHKQAKLFGLQLTPLPTRRCQ